MWGVVGGVVLAIGGAAMMALGGGQIRAAREAGKADDPTGRALFTAGTIAAPTGAAVVAAMVVWLIVDDEQTQEERLRVAVGPTGALHRACHDEDRRIRVRRVPDG